MIASLRNIAVTLVAACTIASVSAAAPSYVDITWMSIANMYFEVGALGILADGYFSRIPQSEFYGGGGGLKMVLSDGVTMRVVRLNHSGNPATNPEQHNPVELESIPVRDPATGGLRLGVAEDFPNGGGTRGFLFTVDGPQGRFSWFYEDSISPVDMQIPIVVSGVGYGAPLDNLKAAMKDAGLESVDLWIGTGGLAVAQLVQPVVKAKNYIPVHWDGLYGAFRAGIPKPYSDPALEEFLARSGVKLLKAGQYMDKWRLDRDGVRPMANTAIKRALGFAEVQSFAQ